MPPPTSQADRRPTLDAMLADLATMVEIESPSYDQEALRRSAAALGAMMERLLGHSPSLLESANGPHVHWHGGGVPRVLLVGHHDTVFPLGALAQRPFRVEGGRATGPGVFDMKAGIVQALHGLAGLDARVLDAVEILVTADEEVGSTTSQALIEERALACGAVLVLEPSADGGALKIARKGTGTFEVLVHGRAAHAGLEPENGRNALIEAAHQVLHIATLGDAALGTTVTPTMAQAGTADNVVPALASVKVDVRVVAPGEKERIEAAMHSLAPKGPDLTLEVRGGIGRPPMTEASSTELLALAQQVAGERGLPPVEGVAVGGGSDGNFTAALGVPTLDGLGAVGGGAHADHEYVLVDTMPARAELVAGLVAALATRP